MKSLQSCLSNNKAKQQKNFRLFIKFSNRVRKTYKYNKKKNQDFVSLRCCVRKNQVYKKWVDWLTNHNFTNISSIFFFIYTVLIYILYSTYWNNLLRYLHSFCRIIFLCIIFNSSGFRSRLVANNDRKI